MRTRVLLVAAGALTLGAATLSGPLSGAAFGDSHARSSHGSSDLLRAPLAGSLTTDPPVFGVPPGGAPWVVDRGSAVRVRQGGQLELKVRGLVIPGRGTGPVTSVAASLACNGAIVDTTAPVPLSVTGAARIREKVTVPERCIAPVVFVNPNGNTAVFIAITGSQR